MVSAEMTAKGLGNYYGGQHRHPALYPHRYPAMNPHRHPAMYPHHHPAMYPHRHPAMYPHRHPAMVLGGIQKLFQETTSYSFRQRRFNLCNTYQTPPTTNGTLTATTCSLENKVNQGLGNINM